MNQNQEMFYHFFMERVMDDKKEEAKAILMENFAAQDAGTFTKEYMEAAMPRLMALVKPECMPELMEAAAHMKGTL